MDDNELLQAIGNIMDKKISPLRDDISGINARLVKIEKKVTSIEMTLENETNKNIMRIAEGHFDLTRKLNTAIHIASDVQAKQEIQDIYINTHESEIRKIARGIQ